MTTRNQSSHIEPNGMLMATRTASPAHHERRWIPANAKGKSDGLSRANGPGQPSWKPHATAATDHMIGLPHQIVSRLYGTARRRAAARSPAGCGRQDAMAAIVRAIGIAHQRTAGKNAKGTNSHRVTGGYRTSPDWIS